MINETSERINQIIDINIILKDHQLAMIKKCVDIEDMNICNMGIMSDKPGAGKTYAILGLIYYTKKKGNIIVVPQNIINQWCNSIDTFSNKKLKYKKFIDYNDILDLYNENTKLFDYDILITTSLYYHVISTTMKSNFLNVERVFFDEIDSISSFVVNQINANFVWFVSASIDYDMLGIYTNKIDRCLLSYITCKCENDFIDAIFKLDTVNVYKIICKNIYLDNIFYDILSKEEFNVLNALDYSKLKKKFCNKIAQNEKEALEYLVKDKLDIIDIETIRIEDLNKALQVYNNDINNDRYIILKNQLDKAEKSLEDSNYKLNLIRTRLKENNCCPLCYEEFNPMQKKVLSHCCKNTFCYECTDSWFNKMNKNNCIYCNLDNIKFEDYIILKPLIDNYCILCEKEYENKDAKYYSECCKKYSCIDCLKEWYHKLLKTKCLFCEKSDILFEDFKNEKQHEETKLNVQSGIKYTRKTKIEFLEYFIRTKIYSNCKIIFCSNYIRIFNDIKKLFTHYNIHYLELDDGNINDIHQSIQEYTNGNINVLLLNSNLFGCGLNLECTTDVLFLHKTEENLEKQIIGRAQRYGRKSQLNVWYIMHENETIIHTKKNNDYILYENSINDIDIINENYDSFTII